MKYFAKLTGGETYWTRGMNFTKGIELEVVQDHADYLKGRADLFEVREEGAPKKKPSTKKKTEEKVGE